MVKKIFKCHTSVKLIRNCYLQSMQLSETSKLSIKKNDSEIEVKDDNTEDSTRNT